jgi:hypothetical protein
MRRVALAAATAAALSAVLLLAACVTATPPAESTAPLEWTRVAGAQAAEVVTRDPDGDLRVTTVWIAVVDGSGFLRTSDVRSLENMQRDPNVVLRIGGAAHRLRAEAIADPVLASRAEQAFRQKYGFALQLLRWLPLREGSMLRLAERPAG